MKDLRNLKKHPVPTVGDRSLYDLAIGLFGSQAFLVALDLDLFPHLARSPAGVSEIVARFGLAARSAEALLLVCVSSVSCSAMAIPSASRSAAAPICCRKSRSTWGTSCAQRPSPNRGSPPFPPCAARSSRIARRSTRQELFESHAQVAGRARQFTMMMHGHSIASALAWPLQLDLAGVRHMVDIGGGSSAHAIGADLRWPHLSAEILEIAAVVPVAEEIVARYRLSDRVEATVGDFWSDPLSAGDLHSSGDVFHDWPDDKCIDLMAKSFDVLPAGGRIMIHEVLYHDDKSGPFLAAALSVVMLAWTEGKQRSASDYATLLESAGFRDVAVDPAFGYWSIVSARRPT